ncbi:hypothetical protein D770_09300 [Flammeovirgaceae bacterium 311]|nr:hypothetical protein D770_09300 [Flammeovirgaceae bacterium 311]
MFTGSSMNHPLSLEEQELSYLQDTEFLRAKLNIQDSLRALLEKTQQQLSQQKQTLALPAAVWEVPPKISRGENYEGLPYLVLDYPRIFQQEAIFAYRCMFWWGHGFSCTLHLGGRYWQEYQQAILQHLSRLSDDADQWWLCVNKSPWEYHYRPNNYINLRELQQKEILQPLAQNSFFKISRRLPIRRYQELPQFSLESLQRIAELLK